MYCFAIKYMNSKSYFFLLVHTSSLVDKSNEFEMITKTITLRNRLRFEKPQEKNRWDSPLFHVNMTPVSDRTVGGVEMEVEKQKIENLIREAEVIEGKGGSIVSGDTISANAPTIKTVFRRTVFKTKKATESTSSISPSTAPYDEPVDGGGHAPLDATYLSISGSTSTRSTIGRGNPPEVRINKC